MLIKKETIDPDPPVVVEHTREVMTDNSGTGVAIVFILLCAVAIAVIGYFAWWSPTHTDVYVSQPPTQSSGRAQTIVNNPPANSNPIIIHEHESAPPAQNQNSGSNSGTSSGQSSTSGSSENGSGNSNQGTTSGNQTEGP